jgi:ATP adenylyltransferase
VDEPRRPLWAPWRMEYVGGGRSACIFCGLDDRSGDPARLILLRGEHCFVLLNRFPYAAGHLMVAPYGHVGRIQDLPGPAAQELTLRLQQCAAILQDAYRCEGYNVGANIGTAAGAGFADHLHFHLVPRWTGDVNFMTSIGELRVIPAHLERTYAELAPRFAALEGAA